MARKVCFSLLVLIFSFQRNYGLLLPNVAGSQCTLNSTETDCLLKRINELNNRISALESKQAPNCQNVAFMASLSKSIPHVQSGVQLKFDSVQLNTGNAYLPFHGNFIAPVSGTYFFTYTATTNPNAWIRIYLKRNGIVVGQLVNTALLNNYLKTTESVVLHLNKSDDIWLETYDIKGDATIAYGTECHFAGFLFHCD